MNLKFQIYISVLLLQQFLTGVVCNESKNATESSISNFLIKNEEQRKCIMQNCDDSFYVPEESENKRKAKSLHIALLLPEKNENHLVIDAVRPVVELAVDYVKKNILIDFKISTHHRDTQKSSTIGPLQAVELFYARKVNVFLGPVCDYVLAPVARYCGVWNMPIITAGGLATGFGWKVRIFIFQK
jgi:hypothetical protein